MMTVEKQFDAFCGELEALLGRKSTVVVLLFICRGFVTSQRLNI